MAQNQKIGLITFADSGVADALGMNPIFVGN